MVDCVPDCVPVCLFVMASRETLNMFIIFSICALFCVVTALTISAMAKALSSASSLAVAVAIPRPDAFAVCLSRFVRFANSF